MTTVVYTGQRESLIRSDIEANISYEALWKKSGDIYLWSAGAVADFGLRNMEGQFYPFYHTQNRLAASLSLWGQLNIDLGSSSILITNARLGFLIGGGTAYETGQYASGSSAVLKQYDTYIRPQFEYETAPQGSVALKIGWNKTVSEKFSFTLSLSDNVKFLVTEPQYLKGKVRNILMLSFGCNF